MPAGHCYRWFYRGGDCRKVFCKKLLNILRKASKITKTLANFARNQQKMIVTPVRLYSSSGRSKKPNGAL